ncbi:MAG: hypothetical protein O3A92_06685 [Verrucomicrobia bacterium]|nr:hypothetical protein [Verrucomicrobiota bacterium]
MNINLLRSFVLGAFFSGSLASLACGDWEAPIIISEPAVSSRSPRAQMDPQGTVFAIFTTSSTSTERVAIRPPGGNFGTPQLSPQPSGWEGVRYAFEASGAGLLAWNDSSDNLKITERQAGASNDYGATQSITTNTPPGYTLYGHFIDINTSGEAVLAYYEKRPSPASGRQLLVATRPAGASSTFGAGEILSINNPNSYFGENVFIDPDGSITVTWLEGNTPSVLKQARRDAGASVFIVSTIASDVNILGGGTAPHGAKSGNGHALITWITPFDVSLQQVTMRASVKVPSGGFGAPQTLGSGRFGSQRGGIAPDGSGFAGWFELIDPSGTCTPDGARIRGSFLSGGLFGPEQRVSTAAERTGSDLDVAVGEDSSLYIIYPTRGLAENDPDPCVAGTYTPTAVVGSVACGGRLG